MNIIKKIFGLLVVTSFFFVGAQIVMGQADEDPQAASYGEDVLSAPSNDVNPVEAPAGGGSAGIAPAGGSAGIAQPGKAGTPLSVSGEGAKIKNPIKYNDFSEFVAAVLKVAVEILMPFVVLAFIWSGFLFVRAQGNPAELEKAKAAILWSIVGAFILMGAWGFAQIISTTVSTLTNLKN